jgi:hypothetical protein
MAYKLLIGTDPSVSGNWSPSGVPTTGDDVVIDSNLTGTVTGVNQSSITLASLTIYGQQFNIGTAAVPWQIGATLCEINKPPSDGSGQAGPSQIALNFGSVQTRVIVYNSASAGLNKREPVLLAGTHASNEVLVRGGVVGIGNMSPGQSSTVATLRVTGGTCNTYAGVTLTTVENDGGTLRTATAITTGRNYSGFWLASGGGLLGVVECWGGSARFENRRSGDEITTLRMRGGEADFSTDPSAVVVANLSLRSGQIKQYSPTQVTFTATTLDWADFNQFSLSAAVV